MTIPTLFEETEQPVQNPAIAEQTRLERVVAGAVAQKAELRERLNEVRMKGAEVQAEISRIEGALASAEQRNRILSAPRPDYIAARSEAIARGLLGESVELSEVQRSADFADNLTASDLAEGLRALRKKRDDIVLRFNALKSQARVITSDYYKAHAVEYGAKYEILRSQITHAYLQIRAADRLNVSIDPMHQIYLDNTTELALPSLDSSEVMSQVRKNPRLNSNDITGTSLARSGVMDSMTTQINRELENK